MRRLLVLGALWLLGASAAHPPSRLAEVVASSLIERVAPGEDAGVSANPVLRVELASGAAQAAAVDRMRWRVSTSQDAFEAETVWDSDDGPLAGSIAVNGASGVFLGSRDGRIGLDDRSRYYWRVTLRSTVTGQTYVSPTWAFVTSFPVILRAAFDGLDALPLVAHRPEISRGLHPAGWSPGEGEWRVRSGVLVPGGPTVNRAMIPAAANGVLTVEVATPAGTAAYGGIHFRFYDVRQLFLLRISTRPADRASLTLVRVRLGKLSEVASANPLILANSRYHLQIVLNGAAIAVSLDGQPQFVYHEGYLGGQEMVGPFSDRRLGSLGFTRFEMVSGDAVLEYPVHARRYEAVIRPGNVGELYIRGTSRPDRNIFMDAGVQFGHASAAEIRLDRSATVGPKGANRVVSQFDFRGRLPLDFDGGAVHGHSDGLATFYADRFVLRDNVRMIGERDPTIDFDFSSVVAAPTFIYSLAGGPFAPYRPTGDDWSLLRQGAPFPHALQVRLRLGTPEGLVTGIVYNIRNLDKTTINWAKNTRDGGTLTFGSGYFPTEEGRTYSFGIVVFVDTSRSGFKPGLAARYRDDWVHPADLECSVGRPKRDVPGDENHDGFNESEGYYAIEADPQGRAECQFVVGAYRRHRPVFRLYAPGGGGTPAVWMNGRAQREGTDFLADRLDPGSVVVQLLHEYGSSVAVGIVAR